MHSRHDTRIVSAPSRVLRQPALVRPYRFSAWSSLPPRGAPSFAPLAVESFFFFFFFVSPKPPIVLLHRLLNKTPSLTRRLELSCPANPPAPLGIRLPPFARDPTDFYPRETLRIRPLFHSRVGRVSAPSRVGKRSAPEHETGSGLSPSRRVGCEL
ncbi:hypothetical protein GQ53DRAFT_515241 [Thozetella sp. PMI_491]|nr:hypothetical protein GQ53DRAFT_515241 [Thozetella sp. PMI_491]